MDLVNQEQSSIRRSAELVLRVYQNEALPGCQLGSSREETESNVRSFFQCFGIENPSFEDLCR